MSRADPVSILQQALSSYRQGDRPNAEEHCRAALRVDAVRSSSLFDSVRYRRRVQNAHELMHDRQKRGEPPADFDVSDEVLNR